MKSACAVSDARDSDKKKHPDNSIRPKAVIKLLAVFLAPVVLIYLFTHVDGIFGILDRSADTRSIRHTAAGTKEGNSPDTAATAWHGSRYLGAIAATLSQPPR